MIYVSVNRPFAETTPATRSRAASPRHRNRLDPPTGSTAVAQPLRFRRAPGQWSADRVRSQLERPLDDNLGATASDPWFGPPPGYDARRFDMDDGSFALLCWTDDDADPPAGASGGPTGYWVGNTETPSELWRTDKYGFDEVPYPVSRWVQRELLAALIRTRSSDADVPSLPDIVAR